MSSRRFIQMLIGCLGHKRSGKDTVANYLVKKYQFTKLSFAEPVKQVCAQMFHFNQEQLYGDLKEENDPYWGISPRQALQFVGTDLVRDQMDKLIPQIGSGFWIRHLERTLEQNPSAFYVVSDVRFPDEVKMIHKYGGQVWKIDRPLDRTDTHSSEAGIDQIQNFDYQLNNHGTLEDLYSQVDQLVHRIEV